MQKSAKGQITIIGLQEASGYALKPSATLILVDRNGNILTKYISCSVLVTENGVFTNKTLPSDTTLVTVAYSYTDSKGTESEKGKYIIDKQIDVTKLISCKSVNFYLYSGVVSDFDSQEYLQVVNVSIVKDGQLDIDFKVWIGENDTPPTPDFRPWDDDDDAMHVGDYYITTDLHYYEFVYVGGQYTWIEVTDANFKKVLERTDRSMRGYIIDESYDPATGDDVSGSAVSNSYDHKMFKKYFEHYGIKYKAGDMMKYASYFYAGLDQIDGFKNSRDLYYCVQDMGNTPKFTDWVISSNVQEKLLDSGIDIDNCTITVTADNLRFINNSGQQAAVFNMYDGNKLKLATNLLRIDGNIEIDEQNTINGWRLSEGLMWYPEGDYHYPVVENRPERVELRLSVGMSTIPDRYAFWSGGLYDKDSDPGSIEDHAKPNFCVDSDGNAFCKNLKAKSVNRDVVIAIPDNNTQSLLLPQNAGSYIYCNGCSKLMLPEAVTGIEYTLIKTSDDKLQTEIVALSDDSVAVAINNGTDYRQSFKFAAGCIKLVAVNQTWFVLSGQDNIIRS